MSTETRWHAARIDPFNGFITSQISQGDLMLISHMDGSVQTAPRNERKPLERFDLDALQRMLQICSMDITIVEADRPHATLGSVRQGPSIACTIEHDFSFRTRFAVPAGYLLVGFVHYTSPHSWSHAQRLTSNSAFSVPSGVDADFLFGVGTRVTLLLVREEMLPGIAGMRRPQSAVPALDIFDASTPATSSRLGKMYQQLRWKILLHSDPSYAAMAEPMDFDTLLEYHFDAGTIRTSEPHDGSRSRHRHYVVVQQVEAYLRANLKRDIYLTQMCHIAKVSERALRYAFDDLLGISPMRFLAMLRLCAASKGLSQADVNRRSVKSVALDCGLRDLSRFADSYRRVFGELPHDTLMKPPRAQPGFAVY